MAWYGSRPWNQPRSAKPRSRPGPMEPVLAREADPPKRGEPLPPRPSSGCGAIVRIEAEEYVLRVAPRETGDDAESATILLKQRYNGELAKLAVYSRLWQCDCEEWSAVATDLEGARQGCRHVRALRALGLLGLVHADAMPAPAEGQRRERRRYFGDGLLDENDPAVRDEERYAWV